MWITSASQPSYKTYEIKEENWFFVRYCYDWFSREKDVTTRCGNYLDIILNIKKRDAVIILNYLDII